MRTVCIHNLEGRSLRIEERYAFDGLELNAVQTGRIAKDTGAHIFHLEIRHHLGLVQSITGLADFVRIVEPVPRLNGAPGRKHTRLNILIHHLLQHLAFFLGAFQRSRHNLRQEFVDGRHILGHFLVQNERSGRSKTQQRSLTLTQGQNFQQHLVIVVLIAIGAPAGIGLEHRLTAGTVGARSHLIRILRHADAEFLLERIAFAQQVLPELEDALGHTGVDGLHLFLLLLGQINTAAHKVRIEALQHAELLPFQALTGFIYGFDAGEQAFVEHNLIAVGRQHRKNFRFQFLDFRGPVRFGHIVEHTGHAAEQATGILQSRNRILKGRSIRVVHNGRNLGIVLPNPLFNRGKIIFGKNFLKRRNIKRGIPLCHQRILSTTGCHHCQSH